MAEPPFQARHYDLGPATLGPIGDDAMALGAVLASVDPWKRAGFGAEAIAANFAKRDPAVYRFAVRVDGQPVGVVTVRYPFMRGPYLETIGLDISVQGRGIGSAVIDWMAAEVDGVAFNLWLCVTEWNEPAVRFYLRQGFRPVGSLPDLVVTGITETFMRKVLRPPP